MWSGSVLGDNNNPNPCQLVLNNNYCIQKQTLIAKSGFFAQWYCEYSERKVMKVRVTDNNNVTYLLLVPENIASLVWAFYNTQVKFGVFLGECKTAGPLLPMGLVGTSPEAQGVSGHTRLGPTRFLKVTPVSIDRQ